ncbi:MAG TPA: hypothetical protein VGX72_15170 [Solirubrobacteraceae bacterium]|jgi:hypothetical protein|nr:hypothetical protein [Solirubrobacteraceae bacterium]
MICTLTARRLKPGAYEDFRGAWDPSAAPSEVIARWKRIYHVRDLDDENVVISFGMFDGSEQELREMQARMGRSDQVSRVQPLVEEVLLDGCYEVVEEITPGAS